MEEDSSEFNLEAGSRTGGSACRRCAPEPSALTWTDLLSEVRAAINQFTRCTYRYRRHVSALPAICSSLCLWLSFIFLFPLAVARTYLLSYYASTFQVSRVYSYNVYIYIYIEDKWYGIYELLTRGVIKRRNKSECSIREERDVYLG